MYVTITLKAVFFGAEFSRLRIPIQGFGKVIVRIPSGAIAMRFDTAMSGQEIKTLANGRVAKLSAGTTRCPRRALGQRRGQRAPCAATMTAEGALDGFWARASFHT